MRHYFFPSVAAIALLSACASPTPSARAPVDIRSEIPPLGGRCAAEPAQSAVGKMATARNVEAARVASGSLMARTVSPGQMMTKEFSPDRLNLLLDGKGKITSVNCG